MMGNATVTRSELARMIDDTLLEPEATVADDFVKTSTGFHPAGGATVQAVEAIAAAVGGHLRIKASGGIRTADEALAMIAAGATRIGTSHTAAILNGVHDE